MTIKAPETPVVPLNTAVAPTTTPTPEQEALSQPLDLLAIVLMVILCLSWGLNQVAVKLAIPDVPPVIQATIRALGATALLTIWMLVRGCRSISATAPSSPAC